MNKNFVCLGLVPFILAFAMLVPDQPDNDVTMAQSLSVLIILCCIIGMGAVSIWYHHGELSRRNDYRDISLRVTLANRRWFFPTSRFRLAGIEPTTSWPRHLTSSMQKTEMSSPPPELRTQGGPDHLNQATGRRLNWQKYLPSFLRDRLPADMSFDRQKYVPSLAQLDIRKHLPTDWRSRGRSGLDRAKSFIVSMLGSAGNSARTARDWGARKYKLMRQKISSKDQSAVMSTHTHDEVEPEQATLVEPASSIGEAETSTSSREYQGRHGQPHTQNRSQLSRELVELTELPEVDLSNDTTLPARGMPEISNAERMAIPTQHELPDREQDDSDPQTTRTELPSRSQIKNAHIAALKEAYDLGEDEVARALLRRLAELPGPH